MPGSDLYNLNKNYIFSINEIQTTTLNYANNPFMFFHAREMVPFTVTYENN